MQYIRVRVPNFRPFRSTINRFQDVVHFRIFPLTPMLKFQSATIFFLIFADRQNIHNFTFPYDSLIYHKVRLDKNYRSSYLKFQLHMVLC